jgi:hypothetical protein
MFSEFFLPLLGRVTPDLPKYAAGESLESISVWRREEILYGNAAMADSELVKKKIPAYTNFVSVPCGTSYRIGHHGAGDIALL